jgi:hypothetical protein
MAQDGDPPKLVRTNQVQPRVTPRAAPIFKFVFKLFKLLNLAKIVEKYLQLGFLMNFMSMESLGCVEFNSVVYFQSFATKSGSNLRLV